jgi:putative ABC transport system permease protein
MILFAAIGLVFLVVCANVANLLLTRGAARRGEMAVRAGLGATRGRLVMQLLVETVVLFVIAALVSLVLTRLALEHVVTLLPLDGAIAAAEIRMDAQALVACLSVSLLSALVFGLVPALVVSQVEPEQVLKQTAARAGASRSHHLVRAALVVAQIVLAFTLLAAGGLALRAFARFNARMPGFEAGGRTMGVINLPLARYADAPASRRFVRDLLETVKREPGVESAAINNDLPMAGGGVYTFMIEGRPPFAAGENPGLTSNTISADYLRTMGIPLLRGRTFTDADRDGAPRVMLINQTMSERFFPGEDPLGHRITFDDASPEAERKWIEIVGVSGDVLRNGLSHPPVPEAFVPVDQADDLHDFAVVVRSSRTDLQRTLPLLVAQVDPQIAVSQVSPLSRLVERSLSMRRTMAVMLLGFAVTALVLAMLGIFGLVSYSTAQRTRELAIRMALGATPGTVIRLVLRGAVVLVGIGLALGLVGALALGRYLSTQMPGVASFDPLVYLLVPALLLGTTVIACVAPALRAVRIPPATALRYE